MLDESEYLTLLKEKVWSKAIGTKQIVLERVYFEHISNAIYKELKERIHWHTIRNLYKNRHKPSPQTLKVLSTYLIGDIDHPKTFEHWKESIETPTPDIHVEEPPTPRRAYLNLKRYGLGLMILILLFIVFCLYKREKATKELYETFSNSNLASLEDEAWFLFPDSINLDLWAKQPDHDYLSLMTYLGDAWLENVEYEPKVINILAKKISCGNCCEIEVKLVGFNPYQRYQQAGFFLFENKTPVPSLRYNFESGGLTNHVAAVLRKGNRSNEPLISASEPRFRRQVVIGKIVDGKPEKLLDSIFLKLRIEKNQYSFYKRINNGVYDAPIRTMDLEFGPPKYLGLAAFQGRPDIPAPVWPVADIIPANFAHVRVTKCKN